MTRKLPRLVLRFLLVALSAGSSLAGAPGTFEPTGSTTNPHAGHTATLLPNGKVLVAGGRYIRTAELYAPSSGSWTATGGMQDMRVQHTATLLPDGTVLVAGGYFEDFFRTWESTELYDPALGTWRTLDSLITGRAQHTATLLANGKVLVAGGFNQNMEYYIRPCLASAEIYDPVSARYWQVTGSLAAKRAGHTATLLTDGKVLVAGGYDFDGHSGPPGTLGTAELYDPATGTWSSTGNLTHPRAGHRATLLKSGKVLVAGGDRMGGAELYDPEKGTWTTTDSLADARAGFTATLLSDHDVLVAGGTTGGSDGNFVYLRSAQLYDPATARWRSTGDLVQPRTGHTATLLDNHKVLIVGGRDRNFAPDSPDLSTAELYTPPPTPPDVRNISTRLRIETGDNAMIGGFIITGNTAKTVIVRGIGPSLGMPGALQDPTIEVRNAWGGLLASNDNWKQFPNDRRS